MLNDLIVCLCQKYGERACVGSFEIAPVRTMLSMFRQATGVYKPLQVDDNGNFTENVPLFEAGVNWLNEHVYFYDFVGVAESKKVLEVFAYAARKYSVKQFVIDSVMCMDIEEDDTQRQKAFMNELREFVLKYNVHIHLVAHSRKPTEKKHEATYKPGKHDVLGSVHLTNLAWNVVSVWRNVSKQLRFDEAYEKMTSATTASQEVEYRRKLDAIVNEHDAVIVVCKQRDGTGELGSKRLWFDTQCKQFRSKLDAPKRCFVTTEG